MAFFYRPYVSIAQRRQMAEETAKKMLKKGTPLLPIKINGKKIAMTFWGQAWCDHLEKFADMDHRLPRGRTYVRNGSVIHLTIDTGRVEALVQGSSLYKIEIKIKPILEKKWKELIKICSTEIGSMIELLQGKLSSSVMEKMTDTKKGLFPHEFKDINFKCSCPDWAYMCKHVAAVLYGVAARLDERPELLFKLRHVDHLELIPNTHISMPKKIGKNRKIVKDQDLSEIFGINLEVTDSPKKKKVKKTSHR